MKEKEIRPKKLFKKFLNLAYLDAKKYFKGKKNYINCVACNKKGIFTFKKKSFTYYECPKCKTLYNNPRSNEKIFFDYYTKSKSSKFWANTFYKNTEKVRRNKMWKPKAKMIFEVIKKNKVKNFTCVDIGGGYGIFAEEIQKLTKKKALVIEPSPFSAQACRKKKLQVIENFLENIKKKDLPSNKRVFTCFELIEHLQNPTKFINNLKGLMNKGDLFIFTTLSGTGVDILTLWKNSGAVSPPFHINFFNPKSIKIFLNRFKLKIINITTPGKIDIDILDNNKAFIQNRFWKTFVNFANDEDKSKMQKLISDINFSSHMMVVCKK